MAHQFFRTLFSSKSSAIFALYSLVVIRRDFVKDLGRRMLSGFKVGDLFIVVLRMPGLVAGEDEEVRRGEYPDDNDMLRGVEVRADIESVRNRA